VTTGLRRGDDAATARSGTSGARTAVGAAGAAAARAKPPRTAARDDLPPADAGRRRAAIENVRPSVDGGRFPIKRVVGDRVHVEADAFADGHDVVNARLLHRHEAESAWTEVEMGGPDNDRWWADFDVDRLGLHQYTIQAWADRFDTWNRDLRKRLDAGQDVTVDLLIGAGLIEAAAERATADGAMDDARRLRDWAAALRAPNANATTRAQALDDGLVLAARRHPDRRDATTFEPALQVVVDRERARFSAWYELFPRSTSPDPERHGTFADVIARLEDVAGMGFDVLYLPPIHPIGRAFRKGPNNAVDATPAAVGSPWAIGSAEGGHTAIHPALGTLDDFRALVSAARTRGIDIALDIAFQAAPDHPFVLEHRDWFRERPDGTIQYAENPPKKYQDIVPFDFESADWRHMWVALRDIFLYWIEQGVSVFRVDNPHTKAFPFWEWCIASIKRDHPETIFLAEAFTRPKPMYRLAKLGFSQSYTYFTWRNSAHDLAEYVTELTTTEVHEFFRPNFWPNTPDILHADLQAGGRPMFQARFVLAATLSSNYGIYGPAFELGVNTPLEPGSEEYLDSEKYEQRTWDLGDPRSLHDLIATVNRARHEHPALQHTDGVRFHRIQNDQLLAYSKHRDGDAVLVVVSLDPRNVQGGALDLDLAAFGLPDDGVLDAVDVLTGDRHAFRRGDFVEIDPLSCAAMLLVRERAVERAG
jgi:starch synthase (maltosyl-transferring)